MSIRSLTNEEMNMLFPIRNLPDNSKSHIQSTIKTESVQANTTIFNAGSQDEQQVYLLEGKICLTLSNNDERVIEGGQMESRFPIDNKNPHSATAITKTSSTIFYITRSLLDDLMNEQLPDIGHDTMSVIDESSESLLSNQLYFDVTQDMQAGKLELPSIPETASKVRKAISNPNISSDGIAKITLQDPAITAQLIRVANSPLFRGREKIESLPPAITRLGLKAVANLISSFTMRMVFNASTPEIKTFISQLWLHSRDVAAICAVIAKKLKGFDPDKAMLAGLVHDIGAIPVLTHADKHPNLLSNKKELRQTLNELTPVIGKMVMDKWNFTEEFSEIATHAEQWNHQSNQSGDYTDLIIVAQLLSFKNTPEQDKHPTPSSVPAYNRLTKQLKDPEDSIDVLENSQEELALIKQLFS